MPLSAIDANAVGEPATAASDYKVTFVARQCQQYTDIMANKARNNIQESLRDLGKDTVYGDGEQVSIKVEEDNYDHLVCTPIVGWKLQLGTGITGKQPSTSNLSTVTGDYSDAITTKASTPVLNPEGKPTGQDVAGAVSITLTEDQARRAQSSSALWVQGGRGSDTLNNADFPGEYGFGALRCAIDNLNGDNVEWIGFPRNQNHVVCYYYAVKPPPEAGTIVVRKQLEAGSFGPATFTYDGNISYADSDGNGTGDFRLTADAGSPGSATFIRAASPDDVWNFTERAEPGWISAGITCNDPQGGSTSTIDLATRRVDATVAEGHTLTCTFTNRRAATGPLELDKVTLGGVGTFPFKVTTPGGTNDFDGNVTTTEPGVAVVVKKVPSGTPGAYTATETLPAATAAGSWSLESATCNGDPVTVTSDGADRTITGTIDDSVSKICTFTNRFTPAGSITIRKVTHGGVGPVAFVAQQFDTEAGDFTGSTSFLNATVTAENTPTTAVVAPGSPPLTELPVDQPTSGYVLRELPPVESDDFTWRQEDVTCNTPTTAITGGVFVTVTSDVPHVECTFTDRKDPTAKLDLTKVVTGKGERSGSVRLALHCADGTNAVVVGPAGKPGPFGFASPYVFRDPTTCTVTETATGVASGSTVSTSIAVAVDGDSTPKVTTGRKVTFPVRLGDSTDVTVTDHYAKKSTGGGGSGGGAGGGSGTGTGAAGTGGSGGTLPVTGPADLRHNAMLGLELALLGGALMILARRREDEPA